MKKTSIVPEEHRIKHDKWHFSPAVECGGFLFVSGCTGARADGSIASDITEQIRQAFRNVELSLAEAGLSYADVVEMVTYHVGIEEHMQEFILVKDEFVGEPYPAWSALGVSCLTSAGAVVEIKVIAKT